MSKGVVLISIGCTIYGDIKNREKGAKWNSNLPLDMCNLLSHDIRTNEQTPINQRVGKLILILG